MNSYMNLDTFQVREADEFILSEHFLIDSDDEIEETEETITGKSEVIKEIQQDEENNYIDTHCHVCDKDFCPCPDRCPNSQMKIGCCNYKICRECNKNWAGQNGEAEYMPELGGDVIHWPCPQCKQMTYSNI